MAAAASLLKYVPLLKRMLIPFLNMVGKKSEFRIIITSPNYIEFRFFWGLMTFEKGEKREFVIRGTEAYINSLMKSSTLMKLDVKKVLLK